MNILFIHVSGSLYRLIGQQSMCQGIVDVRHRGLPFLQLRCHVLYGKGTCTTWFFVPQSWHHLAFATCTKGIFYRVQIDLTLLCFVRTDDVYREVKTQARAAILQLIEKEREGEQVDRALLKNVLGIFIEVGMGGMESYTEDFEKQLLADSAAHYKRKATAWIAVRTQSPNSLPSYMSCMHVTYARYLSACVHDVGCHADTLQGLGP